QLVLTDHGLVPIERVATDMRVWDGYEFVRHAGAVCRGIQEVISYAGLTATPDHKVWTEKGWKAFGQCALACTPIAVTASDRQAIWQTDRRFRRGYPQTWQSTLAGRMFWLQATLTQRIYELGCSTDRWLSKLCASASSAEMAVQSCTACTTALHRRQR